MEKFLVMTGRNLKNYFRSKGAIFFSLLSMLIVICLMVFFLGDMQVESIVEILDQFPGRDGIADEKNAELLVLSWTCAGIISINAVTVTLSVYSTMIKDRATGKLNSIYTAPIGRMAIAASYVASAWTASVLVCGLTLIITEVYGVIKGLDPFTFGVHMQLIGMIMVNSFTYATVMYFLAVISKTESAWSGLGTVVGTLVGFLGGIYIPIGSLSEAIGNVMKCTPVIYGTAMFRSVMAKGIIDTTFADLPDEVTAGYRAVMGIDLELFGREVSVMEEGILILIFGVVFLVIGTGMLKYGKKTDR
ncbi:MAG: ABC transporter permease [Lachnospiraceae bacterium]|nr:ABC transporter permease [Lachnospiraceae bacterium]